MATVWLARHLGLGREVALKILHWRCHGREEVRLRFEREALAIGRLRHPNIVAAIDFGTLGDGRKFLAMEHVPGKTLAEICGRSRRLPWRAAVHVAVQVADALAYAHRCGVVHRDLKPENLIVEGEDPAHGRTLILDLGLAKIRRAAAPSRISDHSVAMGTPRYAAPEQFLGLPVDHRADIYGLCAVLYRLIAGRCPYEGWTFEEVADKMQSGEVMPLRGAYVDGTRPRQLDDLVMAGLARNAQNRPESAEALGATLRAAVQGDRGRLTSPSVAGGALFAFGLVLGAATVAVFDLY